MSRLYANTKPFYTEGGKKIVYYTISDMDDRYILYNLSDGSGTGEENGQEGPRGAQSIRT